MFFNGNLLIMDPYYLPGIDVERLSEIYDQQAPKMRVRRTLDIEAATRDLERRRVLNKTVSASPEVLKEANIEGFISDRSLDGPGLFIGLEITIPLDNMKKEKKASE